MFDEQFEDTDATCELHRTESMCLRNTAMLDSSVSKCRWTTQPDGESICKIQPVQLTFRVSEVSGNVTFESFVLKHCH
jgi:hypothetical protein